MNTPDIPDRPGLPEPDQEWSHEEREAWFLKDYNLTKNLIVSAAEAYIAATRWQEQVDAWLDKKHSPVLREDPDVQQAEDTHRVALLRFRQAEWQADDWQKANPPEEDTWSWPNANKVASILKTMMEQELEAIHDDYATITCFLKPDTLTSPQTEQANDDGPAPVTDREREIFDAGYQAGQTHGRAFKEGFLTHLLSNQFVHSLPAFEQGAAWAQVIEDATDLDDQKLTEASREQTVPDLGAQAAAVYFGDEHQPAWAASMRGNYRWREKGNRQ